MCINCKYILQVVADDDKRVGDKLVEMLEPLLLDAEVDLFVAGHYHSYTRTCAMRNFTCVQDDFNTRGIYHVTAGNAGANLDSPVCLLCVCVCVVNLKSPYSKK